MRVPLFNIVDLRKGRGSRRSRDSAGSLANGRSSSFERDLARPEQLLHEALERDVARASVHTTLGPIRLTRRL